MHSAFCLCGRKSGLARERVVDIALCAAAVEKAGVPGVQRQVVAQAVDQVGVGDEGLAEGHDIGVAVFHGAQRHVAGRSGEHTSELQSQSNIVCRLLLLKKKKKRKIENTRIDRSTSCTL